MKLVQLKENCNNSTQITICDLKKKKKIIQIEDVPCNSISLLEANSFFSNLGG